MYQQRELMRLLKEERDRYCNLAEALELRQSQLPTGSLTYKRGHYYRAVRVHGKKAQIFIPDHVPDTELLIRQLKERRHIAKALPVLKKNVTACNQALEQFKIYDAKKNGEELPAYYKDFNYEGLLLEGDVNPETWAKQPYARNTAYSENLIYESEGGLFTRSKAESEIATVLERRNIFFRYEPRLYLGSHCYYPDFCIVHPVHRRLIYWEHFGKMDDEVYVLHTIEKLRVYSEHGYRLGGNLIMTWETKKSPLTFKQIRDRINLYFS